MKTQILNLFRRIFMIPAAERILAGLTLGKDPLSFISRCTPGHSLYDLNSIRNVVRDGIRYHLDLSDSVDWYIYFGFREASRMKLYSLVKPGDVVMDIGANVGDVTMHVSRIVGNEGRILSFEPDPENFRRFNTNLDLNNFANIRAFNFGFGNVEGKFNMLLYRKDNKGMNRIADPGTTGDFAEVKLTSLDEFSKSGEIPGKVNLVKVDVEGYEFNVLKGAENFIRKYRPVMFIELDDDNLKQQHSSAYDLIFLLEKYGYKIHHAETGDSVHSGSKFENCHYDVIATPLDKTKD